MLSTALGVGANTAIFSVAHALLLRPLTMVIILMGIAAAASYIPARRAARIDPIISLRSE